MSHPMRRFEHRQIREAKAYAAEGCQALHVWQGSADWPEAPRVFREAAARGEQWAHLLDQDADRLRRTARQLGVRRILVSHEGTPRQHIDLCGEPLRRALQLCQPAQLGLLDEENGNA